MEPSVFVLRGRRPGLALASAAGLPVGLAVPVTAFVAAVDPGTQLAAVVIGGVLCAAAVVGVAGGLLGRERLVVDEGGVALARGARDRFRVGWEELAGVSLTIAVAAGPPSASGAAVVPPIVSTSLDLLPADAAVLERHPEMRSFRRAGGGHLWRVRLGVSPAEQEAVGRAVRARRPQLWRGVVGSPGGRIGR